MNFNNVQKDNVTAHNSKAYDSQIRNTIPYYESFHLETINLIQAMEMDPVYWLDTGCGTGSFVETAARIFQKAHFILADPSEAMLEEAKKKLLYYPQTRVTILEPSGTEGLKVLKTGSSANFSEGLPESILDVITAIQSHHYFTKEKRKKSTEVCHNLLKERGVFITFENIRPSTETGIKIALDYWKNFQLSKGKEPEEVKKHLSRFDREYFPITVSEHLELLKEAGFKTAELFWYSYMQAGFYAIK